VSRFEATNACRLEAHYEFRQRPACNVYTVSFSHAPDNHDLLAVMDGYEAWETVGSSLRAAYRTRRSEDHAFMSMRAYSIDPTSNAALIRQGLFVPGEISADTAPMLPTSVSPLVLWHQSADGSSHVGRTYAVGLTTDAMDVHDMEVMNSANRLELGLIFTDLIEQIALSSGGILVHLQTQNGGRLIRPNVQYELHHATLDEKMAGTQRRRSSTLTGPGT
jgi:hypothetical protein